MLGIAREHLLAACTRDKLECLSIDGLRSRIFNLSVICCGRVIRSRRLRDSCRLAFSLGDLNVAVRDCLTRALVNQKSGAYAAVSFANSAVWYAVTLSSTIFAAARAAVSVSAWAAVYAGRARDTARARAIRVSAIFVRTFVSPAVSAADACITAVRASVSAISAACRSDDLVPPPPAILVGGRVGDARRSRGIVAGACPEQQCHARRRMPHGKRPLRRLPRLEGLLPRSHLAWKWKAPVCKLDLQAV